MGGVVAAVVVAAAMQVGAPLAIAGGTPAGVCQFPTVATYRVGDLKCSAVLVHPDAVVTAAHCVADGLPSKMRFGEDFWFEAIEVEVTECFADEGFAQSQAPRYDYAICRLVEPVVGLPPTPLLRPCEDTPLAAGIDVAIVGFGTDDAGADFGTKRFAMTRLDSDLRADGTIWIGEAGRAGCLGDSGGPALVRAEDGGWRVLGVLSFGPECGDGPMLYRALVDRIDWLEAASGLDLGPCRDDTCGPVAGDPLAPDVGWDGACAGPLTTPAAAACTPLPVPPPGEATGGDPTEGMPDGSPQAATSSRCSVGDPGNGPAPLWAWVLVAMARRRMVGARP